MFDRSSPHLQRLTGALKRRVAAVLERRLVVAKQRTLQLVERRRGFRFLSLFVAGQTEEERQNRPEFTRVDIWKAVNRNTAVFKSSRGD